MTQSNSDARDRTREEWSIGSYPTLARSFLAAAAALVDAADVSPGDRVLDVACGTGNVALTADRRGADVTGVDIAPAMLELARKRAAVIESDVEWRAGDAAALDLPDDAFDVTLSCLGHMFVPDPEAAADELVRVTSPGGRVGFVSWTPDSGIAAMMQVLASYLPDQPDPSPPPFRWGDPDVVRDRFGDRVASLQFDSGIVRYPALSPAHFWESMTTDSGAIILALEAVAEDERPALRSEEVETLAEYFSDSDNAMELAYRRVTGTVL